MAKILIDSILPKWNPTMPDRDWCDVLAFTDEELESNKHLIETDQLMFFDPNFALCDIESGFRIFDFEYSLKEIPARRHKLPGRDPGLMAIFLHAKIKHSSDFKPIVKVMIKTESEDFHDSETLSLTFDRPEIPRTFPSALLGGLLIILQNTQKNIPLLICSSSDFLPRALVKERQTFENKILNPAFHLLKAVIARLNERVACIQFKKVTINHAKFLLNTHTRTDEIDTEIDLMFECPGILLSHGSQRLFNKIIRNLQPKPL